MAANVLVDEFQTTAALRILLNAALLPHSPDRHGTNTTSSTLSSLRLEFRTLLESCDPETAAQIICVLLERPIASIAASGMTVRDSAAAKRWKLDKNSGSLIPQLANYMEDSVKKANFVTFKEVQSLLDETEDLYAEHLEDGIRNIAVKKLGTKTEGARSERQSEQQDSSSALFSQCIPDINTGSWTED